MTQEGVLVVLTIRSRAASGDTPGFKFSIPFDGPQDLLKGAGNLLTQGRADPDRFPVVRLDPPPDREGTLFKPFQAHALVDSYFQSLGQWMQSEGPLQKEITERIHERSSSTAWDDQRSLGGFPPGCPECGGEGGSGGFGGNGQGGSRGLLPSTPVSDPRGSISIDIHLGSEDFRTP